MRFILLQSLTFLFLLFVCRADLSHLKAGSVAIEYRNLLQDLLLENACVAPKKLKVIFDKQQRSIFR